MKISSIIDFFIHSVHFDNSDHLRRARLFVRATLLTSIFSISFIFQGIFIEFEIAIYLMIFNVLSFLFILFLAKTKIPISWLGNTYILIGSTAVFIITYYSGGLWSSVFPWIASIPLLALLVVNKTSGIVWGIISLAVMLWYGSLEMDGVLLSYEFNTAYKTIWYVHNMTSLLVIILLIAFVFASNQSSALKELKAKNDLLKEQKSTIESQSEELEKHIDEKDYIIRIMAHDLKNPLTNITSLVKMLEGEKSSDIKEKYLDMIDKSSSKAQDLINRVLEMDVSNQKNEDIQMESVELNRTIKGAIKTMSAAAIKKDIQIKYENPTTNTCVLVDKTCLHFVFENLISNAIKFSEKGTKVVIKVVEGTSNVSINVIDQGPGVMPEEQDKLFHEFEKLSAKPTDGENSSGVGLSLVKKYAELMNGSVSYEDNPKGGAVFVVKFPLENKKHRTSRKY